MDSRKVVGRYYELANAGEWEPWCDLFARDAVIDEQLAGHIEGRQKLREMMRGFPAMYQSFTNKPVHVVVSGDEAAVVSRISAVSASGDAIEAAVCNYFRIADGAIAYMANYHDTVPFAPVISR
jgi:ketosteroid isomerase-like protein